jgi:hypothetical protein
VDNTKLLITRLIDPEVFKPEEPANVRFSVTVERDVNRHLDYICKKFNVSKTRLAGDVLEAFVADFLCELNPDPNTDSEYRRTLCRESQEEIDSQIMADLDSEREAEEDAAKNYFKED